MIIGDGSGGAVRLMFSSRVFQTASVCQFDSCSVRSKHVLRAAAPGLAAEMPNPVGCSDFLSTDYVHESVVSILMVILERPHQ
jgi:hypothetical protein